MSASKVRKYFIIKNSMTVYVLFVIHCKESPAVLSALSALSTLAYLADAMFG